MLPLRYATLKSWEWAWGGLEGSHTSYNTFSLLFITQTREQVSKCPKGHLTPSLVSQPLSGEQWTQLDRINDELTEEYSVRRQMLLTRCDVTVQSFRWSDRVKVLIMLTFDKVVVYI